MNTNETNPNHLSFESYAQAMNLIGQNLLKCLGETVQSLDNPLRNNEVAMQGVAAFLVNVFYQQFPQDQETRQQMLERLTTLVQSHLTEVRIDA